MYLLAYQVVSLVEGGSAQNNLDSQDLVNFDAFDFDDSMVTQTIRLASVYSYAYCHLMNPWPCL